MTFETQAGSEPATDPSATEPSPSRAGRPRPSTARPGARYIPALLDAVIPGLGHLAAGRRRWAVIFLTPVIVAIGAAVVIGLTTSGPRLVAELVASEVIWALLAVQGLFLLWRLLAVASSIWNPALPSPTARDAIPIVILLLLVVAPQAWAGYATETARESMDEIFVEPTPLAAAVPSQTPAPDPSNLDTPPPTASAAAAVAPSASPSPSPTPGVPRITGLIVGVDSGVGRNTYLTDTMIVVSLDPVTDTVSMLSIPRDMVDVPLPDGRRYRGKINELVSYARHHPAQFPGSDGTGFDVLMGALGTLIDRPIDYYAKVDLGGFVRVVDTLGGVDVNVAHAFCDPEYDEYGFTSGFSITAGRHHLTGQQALAFARVRKASGESDFTRAARQQEILSGIRDRVAKGGFLNDPIGLVRAVGKTVETNVPRRLLPDLADAASRIGRAQTYRAVITQPLVRGAFDSRGSIQLPDVKGIRALADDLFPEAGTLPVKSYVVPASSGSVKGSGVSACGPGPTPKPAPKPTRKPTARPTARPTATHAATPVPTPSSAPSPPPEPPPSEPAAS